MTLTWICLNAVFRSTATPQIRVKALTALTKILYFSTSQVLTELLRETACSSLIASMLVSKDLATVGTGMRLYVLSLPLSFSYSGESQH